MALKRLYNLCKKAIKFQDHYRKDNILMLFGTQIILVKYKYKKIQIFFYGFIVI